MAFLGVSHERRGEAALAAQWNPRYRFSGRWHSSSCDEPPPRLMMPTDCVVCVLALVKWRARGATPIDKVSLLPRQDVFGWLRGDRRLAWCVTGPIASL